MRALTHFAYDFARNKAGVPAAFADEWHRLLSAALAGSTDQVMEEIDVLARLLILSRRARE